MSATEDVGEASADVITRSVGRRWLFRLAAVVIGVLPIVAVEVGLRAAGRGDGFVDGFEERRRLFVANESGERFEVASNRLGYFRPESFPAVKSAGQRRVFCLGGSTVQGRPYAIETSFTTWLELSLNASGDEARWDVVNCGGVSYASYRLSPILDEVLAYEPDLVVLCTGHNEFLEDREWREPSAGGLKTVAAVRSLFDRGPREARALLPAEVDALLDYRGGLEKYDHDTTWHREVADQFEANLRWMLGRCRDAGVPVLLVCPVSDLRETPPFKAEHGPTVSSEAVVAWEAARRDAREALAVRPVDYAAAVDGYRRATEIDPLHAGTWYAFAKCLEASGDVAAAGEAYRRARDTDVCPLRMTSELRERMRSVARDCGVDLIDLQAVLASTSVDGFLESRWMLDHVHPTIAGHQVFAREIGAWMADRGMVSGSGGWDERRTRAYDEHLSSLEPGYFTEGTRRLERVTNWARGRGEKE